MQARFSRITAASNRSRHRTLGQSTRFIDLLSHRLGISDALTLHLLDLSEMGDVALS
jgi:hypothetical protein